MRARELSGQAALGPLPRVPGAPSSGRTHPRLVAGLLIGALNACAAEPVRRTTDAGAAADAAKWEGSVIEDGVPVTCVTTLPRTTPIDPERAGTRCLFELSPPLPAEALYLDVLIEGVSLPSSEYELDGQDLLELTGAACEDYREGKIRNVTLVVACQAY